jgi:hypothetical protein
VVKGILHLLDGSDLFGSTLVGRLEPFVEYSISRLALGSQCVLNRQRYSPYGEPLPTKAFCKFVKASMFCL